MSESGVLRVSDGNPSSLLGRKIRLHLSKSGGWFRKIRGGEKFTRFKSELRCNHHVYRKNYLSLR